MESGTTKPPRKWLLAVEGVEKKLWGWCTQNDSPRTEAYRHGALHRNILITTAGEDSVTLSGVQRLNLTELGKVK